MPSKLKNILAFARLGIAILPLAPESLEPAVGGGAKAAVTDPKTLRAFYKKHAEYNYGLVMEGGTFAVRANDKRARLRLRKLSGGSLPKTITFRSGPFRFYVLRSDGMQVSSSEGQLGKGLDVLGDGSYVLGPGCILSSGAKCRFSEGRALGEVEIARSPKWSSNTISAAPAPASTEPYPPGTQVVVSLPISAIFVNPTHPLDPDDVQLLDSSIGVLGLHTPITVMRRKSGSNPKGEVTFDVVAGHSRLAAMKKRGCDRIDAFVVDCDEIDARLWGIAENVDRRVPSVLEVAEKSAEFDRLLGQKLEQVVQGAPPGGEQPHDRGIRKAAKRLGISREKVRRRRLVSGLSAEAKAEAKILRLHDNQAALLDAAKEDTPTAQTAKVREMAARKRAPRHQRTADVKKPYSEGLSPKADRRPAELTRAADRAELSSLKAELKEKSSAIASLQAEVTAKADLVKKLEAAHRTVLATTVAPPKVPQGVGDDIPAFLDRRPLTVDDQRAFDAINAAWISHLQTLWDNASAVVRERFISEVLRANTALRSSAD